MELHQTLLGHDGCVNALCWSRDGQHLYSGSDDSTICIWRAAGDGSRLCRFQTGFGERVFDLKTLPQPNGHLLAACSMDSTVKVFDVRRVLDLANAAKIFANTARPAADSALDGSGCCVRTFSAHTGPAKRVAVIPDSPYELLSCSEDGTVRHFDIREQARASEGRLAADYSAVGAEIHALDVNPFRPLIFAAAGSLTSIMVHDRRMARSGATRGRSRPLRGEDWAGDQCIVRLRRSEAEAMDSAAEQVSDEIVTGLRFSRDEPDLMVGSWCYGHIYLFDLRQSRAYAGALGDGAAERGRTRRLPRDWPARPLKRARVAEAFAASGGAGAPRPRAFGRGASLGARVLSREEAPHMYSSSDSDSDSGAGDAHGHGRADRCGFCGRDARGFGRAASALQTRGSSARSLTSAWTESERILVEDAFSAFVSSMASRSLQRALAATSFALRNISSQEGHGSGWPRAAALRLQAGCCAPEEVERAMLAVYTDPGLDRLRVGSVLDNNRACLYATMLRRQWIELFDASLRHIGASRHDPDAMRRIASDAQHLQALWESAWRCSNAALGRNQLNIPAHYNRLLLAWDGARLDVMRFILQLLPLAERQPDSGDDPTQGRLRAEFGDVGHRSKEAHERISACRQDVCDEAAAVHELYRVMSGAGHSGRGSSDDDSDDGAIVAYLVHSGEAFFGVSSEAAGELGRAAAQVQGLLEQSRSLFAAAPPSSAGGTDYESALQEAAAWWRALSAEEHDMDGEDDIFGGVLFRGRSSDNREPHAYVWHRHLCYAEDDGGTRLGLTGADIDDLPTLFAGRGTGAAADTGRSEPASGSSSLSDAPSSGVWPRRAREVVPGAQDAAAYSSGSSDSAVSHDGGPGRPVPVVLPTRRYRGHCSFQTVKDVNFVFGGYVASGSDDGCLFVWDRQTMDVVQIIRGDSEIVNIVESHPTLPLVAVSGIDSEVQIFRLSQGGPSAAHRRNFPMVREAQVLAAGLRSAAARDACLDMIYSADPYLDELERTGHSPLPAGFDFAAFRRRIQQPFPAVSTSLLAQRVQIMRRNEDMRLSGRAHSTLTQQILSNLLFQSGARSSDGEESSGDNRSTSSSASFGYSARDGDE
ncbi:hypothetical protein H4R18_002586 [Coemansia javaensis]|uniref:WD40 repeat-like protein n=1 Tax=Coemansia javaensis TaxID=2761396 RepID=A0A9W8HAC1_9FUNG|nr:hypothetical protein H4R18_002586 [Coemansia javaensis]